MHPNDRKELVAPYLDYAVADEQALGYIEYSSWLSDRLLLLVGWFGLDQDTSLDITLVGNDHVLPLDAVYLSYPRLDIPLPGLFSGKVVLLRFPQLTEQLSLRGNLVVRTGTAVFELAPSDLTATVTDLSTLAQRGLAGLPAEQHRKLFVVLNDVLRDETFIGAQLSRSLYALREALRERLPACIIAPGQSCGVHIDSILAISQRGFFVKGWLWNDEATITQLSLVAPEGWSIDILDHLIYHPRPDVAALYGASQQLQREQQSGFICYVESPWPSTLPTRWLLEVRDSAGIAVESALPRVVLDPIAARDTLLSSLPLDIFPQDDLMRYHVFPAITGLQERLRPMVQVASVTQYGTPSPSPDVSVIIPLYGRIDFVEQQLAQFAHDPELHVADLIYVLDSPEQAASLRDAAAQLIELYGVPFRIVTLKHNVGFSAANNVGVGFARGRLLLLLNSDVLPDHPGWLRKMVEFYDATPDIGALGPKLLYEDNSLQHAGMYFHLPKGTALANLWQNVHYFKGLNRSLAAANMIRPVPALTGACLMIAKNLYHQVGGLQEIYLQGDHEDSDLCLRLIEAGYTNWYFPDAELYHLEAQSYPSVVRGRTALYNRWLHTMLWDERIKAVMDRYPFPTAHSTSR